MVQGTGTLIVRLNNLQIEGARSSSHTARQICDAVKNGANVVAHAYLNDGSCDYTIFYLNMYAPMMAEFVHFEQGECISFIIDDEEGTVIVKSYIMNED